MCISETLEITKRLWLESKASLVVVTWIRQEPNPAELKTFGLAI